MPRVLAVNNYSTDEWFVPLKTSLTSNGAKVTVAPGADSSASLFNKYDAVVLSGSPDMLSETRIQDKYSSEIRAVRGTKVPILGICFGLQLIGCAFGSKVVKMGPMIREYVDTEIIVPDPLFSGLPKTISVLESHEEILDRLPDGFQLLAKSRTSPIAAARHSKAPIRGLQFHPERNTPESPQGNTIVSNFVKSLG